MPSDDNGDKPYGKSCDNCGLWREKCLAADSGLACTVDLHLRRIGAAIKRNKKAALLLGTPTFCKRPAA